MTVMDEGVACPDDRHRILPSSPGNLVYAGVSRDDDINKAPDWGLIIG